MINSLAAIMTVAVMLFTSYTFEPAVEEEAKEVYTVEFRDSENTPVIDVNDILRAEAVYGPISAYSDPEWYVKITFT